VAKYGKGYKSLEYILRNHLYGAADLECDHWHDDAGMINHHVAITWQFEQVTISPMFYPLDLFVVTFDDPIFM
jgi:hypothetical protein